VSEPAERTSQWREPSLPPPAPPAWAGLATGTGLGLAVVSALSLIGIVAQGLAVVQKTSFFYKLGIAFLRNLDATPIGLMLVVALALVLAPALTGATTSRGQDRQATIAFGLVAVVAVLVAAGAVLGVVTRLHFDTGPGQEITTVTRRVLATFLVRSMGPALVAFGAAVVGMPVRFPRPVTAAPYAEDGGADPEPGTAADPH
jgi:hypothetical protein